MLTVGVVSTYADVRARLQGSPLKVADRAITLGRCFIRDLITQPGLPAEAGLRITPQGGGAGGPSLAEGPQAGDQVIEDEI